MTILAFAASNSSKSINHQLVSYAASLCPDSHVIKLTNYDIPLYCIDDEEAHGIPVNVQNLCNDIAPHDGLIISLAEHNGSPPAFFKNQIDWLSRHQRHFLQDKKVVLLSTSPGASGGQSALEVTKKMLPFFGAEIVSELSVPKFYEVFAEGKLIDDELNEWLKMALRPLA